MTATLPWFAIVLLMASTLVAEMPIYEVVDGAVTISGVAPQNPIVYDNDWWFDVFDNNYLWLQSSSGHADLRGNVVTRDMWEWKTGYFYKMRDCVNDANKAIGLARDSGLQNIPDPILGSDKVLVRPDSGLIADTQTYPSDGSRLIVAEARKASPERPLLVICGGPLTTVANAICSDPAIAANMIVFSLTVDSGGYNGKDAWSVYVVAKRTRLVDWATGSFWEKHSVFTPADFERLPHNPFCDDMRRLIASELGQANQLGDGAALVWLWRNGCWAGGQRRQAVWRDDQVQFVSVADEQNADVLVIPRDETDLTACHDEFFRVILQEHSER